MGSSNDGSLAAQSALGPNTDEPAEPGQTGFFSRLLSAFSPSDNGSAAADTPSATASPANGNLNLPGIGNLRRLRVDDVAIPKVEIAAVPLEIGRDELVEVFRKQGFSRMPVYKGSLDHPQGLVLLKDLALQHGFGSGGRFSLRNLLRPVLYAPPSMPIGVLLQKMQRERVHMALVIDEYGGVDGLVTIEDLIETVIGQIDDEHDEAEGALWAQEKPGVYLVQSRAPLDEFEAEIGLKLRLGEDDEDIDTLGGLIFLRIGRVPARGEIVAHESGAEFEVIDADPRRIKRLRVRLPGAQATPVALLAKPEPERLEPSGPAGA
ncbi:HlyC/CorC family transporter [Fertoebacter nigrum]|uniref:HlyC/CorC family transporter n=1 Tax=Fertoeibacter niger TaxID=2656921 RepID=A0A8X8H0Y0_9RHOB|nr:hemolysin family protein [Fertoeibacter niger]NUB44204.1 HlyC/CorC family transporter [Fertoeibacter niger]